jgi:hypothetical protein
MNAGAPEGKHTSGIQCSQSFHASSGNTEPFELNTTGMLLKWHSTKYYLMVLIGNPRLPPSDEKL